MRLLTICFGLFLSSQAKDFANILSVHQCVVHQLDFQWRNDSFNQPKNNSDRINWHFMPILWFSVDIKSNLRSNKFGYRVKRKKNGLPSPGSVLRLSIKVILFDEHENWFQHCTCIILNVRIGISQRQRDKKRFVCQCMNVNALRIYLRSYFFLPLLIVQCSAVHWWISAVIGLNLISYRTCFPSTQLKLTSATRTKIN